MNTPEAKLQNIVATQLAERSKKRKVAKTIKIIAVVLITLLIGFVGAVVICAELGQHWAIGITEWFSENYGVTIGAGVLGSLAIVGKYITSINVNTTNNESLLAKAVDYVVKSNTDTTNNIDDMARKIGELASEIVIQPETLQELRAKEESNEQMLLLIFEVLKLWMQKHYADLDIKQLYSNFEKSKLFEKAKALVMPEEPLPPQVQTAGDIIRDTKIKTAKSATTAAIKAVTK